MFEHSDKYVEKCIKVGILTKDSIRKYPLRNANLAVVLKSFATQVNVPYTISKAGYDVLDDYRLYLTAGGLDWLLDFFGAHSLAYLRSIYTFVFANAAKYDVINPNYQGYNNFLGITGDRPKAGTKQAAILMHGKKRYNFDTLREARKEVLLLSRFYPIDEFILYRIRKLTKNGKVTHYKEKVRLILPPNRRGLNSNLPHLRK